MTWMPAPNDPLFLLITAGFAITDSLIGAGLALRKRKQPFRHGVEQ